VPRALLLFERDLASLPVDLAEHPALEVLDLNRNPRLGRLPDLGGLARLRYNAIPAALQPLAERGGVLWHPM
jgi:hypothetical protein